MLPFSDPNDRPRSRIAAESLQNDRAEEKAALKEIWGARSEKRAEAAESTECSRRSEAGKQKGRRAKKARAEGYGEVQANALYR